MIQFGKGPQTDYVQLSYFIRQLMSSVTQMCFITIQMENKSHLRTMLDLGISQANNLSVPTALFQPVTSSLSCLLLHPRPAHFPHPATALL